MRGVEAAVVVASFWLAAAPVLAEPPDAAAVLADLGLGADDIAQVKAGQIVRATIDPASEREIVSAMAFQLSAAPAQLVGDVKRDLLDQVDPNVLAFGVVSGAGSAADFGKLTLEPGAAARAAAYATAQPGGALNLSTDEIASFAKLGAAAPVATVEAQVRSTLLARLQAYRSQGLAGIAPYARGSGQRSAAEEIRTATNASKRLEQYAPAAYKALTDYPQGKPPGTEEVFHWTQFEAHGTPTLALTHVLLVPDGDAWIVAQRQFYVSTGYNAEQALAAFLPTKGGTVVAYSNRTSTDQITGFGGSAKRSIGSKLLASQLETMFERARAAAQ